MSKLKRKWHRISLFKKSIIILIGVIITLTIIFTSYVYMVMKEYEESLIDNYIVKIANNGTLATSLDIKDYDKNKYENSKLSVTKAVSNLLKNSELKIDKVKGKENTYSVSSEGIEIAEVKLKNTGTKKRLLILSIDEWKVVDVHTNFERGVYYYDINIPSNYTLEVNHKKVDDNDILESKDVSGLEKLTEYVEVKKHNYYELNNFVKSADIEIKDENGKLVEYKIVDHKIEINHKFKTYKDYETFKKENNITLDVMALAENWSLFLTDDLKGANHGFNILEPYLIKDSSMYQMAYGWAHNVDITFVSKHSLKNPVFTNGKISNCIKYNDKAFSCEIYLEKNMRVFNNPNKIDIMRDIMYFVDYEGSFKLVDMKAITEE